MPTKFNNINLEKKRDKSKNQQQHQFNLNNQQNSILNQTQMIPESESYYLNRLPNSFLCTNNEKFLNYNESPIDNSRKTAESNTNPIIKSVILRNSADREMTPDSIDDDIENSKTKISFYFESQTLF